MAQSGDFVSDVGIAAGTGVGGETAFGAGGLGHHGFVVMAQSGDFVSDVGIAADTGVGGETILSAGGSGDRGFIAMTQCGDDLNVTVAAVAGVSNGTGCGAVCFHGHGCVAVAQGRYVVAGVAVMAALAGVVGETAFGTGGLRHNGLVFMAQGFDDFHIVDAADGAGNGDGTGLGTGSLHSDGGGAVTQRFGLITDVAVAAGAGVGSEAIFSAGRLGHHGVVVMARSGDFVSDVGIAADTGVGGETVLGAGGLGHHGFVVMAQGLDDFHMAVAADGAGGGHRAVFGTGSLHSDGGGAVLAGGGDLFAVSIAAAAAGIGPDAIPGAGGLGNSAVIVVARSSDFVGYIAVAAGAGIGGVAVFGAGGSSDGCFIAVTGSGDLFPVAVAAVVTGVGNGTVFGAGCLRGHRLIIMVAGIGISFGGDLDVLVNRAFAPGEGELHIAAAVGAGEGDQAAVGDAGDDSLGIILDFEGEAAAGGEVSLLAVSQQSKLQLGGVLAEDLMEAGSVQGVGRRLGNGDPDGDFLVDPHLSGAGGAVDGGSPLPVFGAVGGVVQVSGGAAGGLQPDGRCVVGHSGSLAGAGLQCVGIGAANVAAVVGEGEAGAAAGGGPDSVGIVQLNVAVGVGDGTGGDRGGVDGNGLPALAAGIVQVGDQIAAGDIVLADEEVLAVVLEGIHPDIDGLFLISGAACYQGVLGVFRDLFLADQENAEAVGGKGNGAVVGGLDYGDPGDGIAVLRGPENRGGSDTGGDGQGHHGFGAFRVTGHPDVIADTAAHQGGSLLIGGAVGADAACGETGGAGGRYFHGNTGGGIRKDLVPDLDLELGSQTLVCDLDRIASGGVHIIAGDGSSGGDILGLASGLKRDSQIQFVTGEIGGAAGNCQFGLGNGKFTADSLVNGIAAGVDTLGIIGGEADAVGIDADSHSGTLTGGAAGGAGGGGGQITGAQMGEIQHLADGCQIVVVLPAGTGLVGIVPVGTVGELSGSHSHGGTLGIVVIAAGVILVIVAVEECNVHFLSHLVDGIAPVGCPAVVVAVVEQRLMGNDQQRPVLVQGSGIRLEVFDGLRNRSGETLGSAVIAAGGVIETGIVAVIGTQVAHAQGVDVVVAVVLGAVDAVAACAVNQTAFFIDAGTVTVMVGPDIVDRHGAVAQSGTDVAGNLGRIAGVLGGICVDGESIAAACDAGDGKTGILECGHDSLDGAFLVVAGTGVQITENDRSVNGIGILRCGYMHGQHGEDRCQNQQQGKDASGLFEYVHK